MHRPVARRAPQAANHLKSLRNRRDISPVGVVVGAALLTALALPTAARAQCAVTVHEAKNHAVRVAAECKKAPTFQIVERDGARAYAVEIVGAQLPKEFLRPVAEGALLQAATLEPGQTPPRVLVDLYFDADFSVATNGKNITVEFLPYDDAATLKKAQVVRLKARAEQAKVRLAQAKVSATTGVDAAKRAALTASAEKNKAEASVNAEAARLAKARAEAEAKKKADALAEKQRLEKLKRAKLKAEEQARKKAALAEKQRIEKARLERLRVEEEARKKAAALAEKQRLEKLKAEEEARKKAAALAEKQRLEKLRLKEEARKKAAALAEKQRLEKLRIEKQKAEEEAKRKAAAALAEKKRLEEVRLAKLKAEAEAKKKAAALAEKQRLEKLRLEKLKAEAEAKKKALAEKQRQEELRIEKLRIEKLKAEEEARKKALAEKQHLEKLRIEKLKAEEEAKKRALADEQRRKNEQAARARAAQKQREAKRKQREAEHAAKKREALMAKKRAAEAAMAKPKAPKRPFGFGGNKSIELSSADSNAYTLVDSPFVDDDAFGGDTYVGNARGVLSEITIERDSKKRSKVGIRVEGGARFYVQKAEGNKLVVTLFDTQAKNLNVRRILDARRLKTSVLRVLPHVASDGRRRVELVIEMRDATGVRIDQDRQTLWLVVG